MRTKEKEITTKFHSKLDGSFIRSLLLILLLSTAQYANAEGGYCWIHKVKVEVGEEIMTGYIKGYAWALNSELFSDPALYTREIINYANSQAVDIDHQFVYFYHELIQLKLPRIDYSQAHLEIELNHLIGSPKKLSTSSVSSVTYLENIDCTMGYEVISPMALSDSHWAHEKPVEVVQIGGMYCLYNVYIFENDFDAEGHKELWDKLIKFDETEADQGRDYGTTFRDEIRKLSHLKIIVLASCYC